MLEIALNVILEWWEGLQDSGTERGLGIIGQRPAPVYTHHHKAARRTNIRCRSHQVTPLPKPSAGFLLLLEKSRFSVSRALGIWSLPTFQAPHPVILSRHPMCSAALSFLWLHKHTKLTFLDAWHMPSLLPPTLFPGCPHGCHFLVTRVSAETSPSQRLPWPLPELTLLHSFSLHTHFTHFYILHWWELSH